MVPSKIYCFAHASPPIGKLHRLIWSPNYDQQNPRQHKSTSHFSKFFKCNPKGWAAPGCVRCTGQHLKASEQAQMDTSPQKIMWQVKTHVRVIPVVTLIRTDTTLDHSQKAEKVWKVNRLRQLGGINAMHTHRFKPIQLLHNNFGSNRLSILKA